MKNCNVDFNRCVDGFIARRDTFYWKSEDFAIVLKTQVESQILCGLCASTKRLNKVYHFL